MSLMRWIGVVAATAVAVLVAMVFAVATVRAQDGAQSGQTKPAMMALGADPDWNVVTVRPSDPNARRDGFDVRGRRVVVENKPVEDMLMVAYGLQKNQIVGLPDWAKTERFDVDGVPNIDGQPGWPQTQILMRKLLAERFGLKVHHDQREMQVYALTVAKSGPKLEPSKGDPNGLPRQDAHTSAGERRVGFTNTSMKDLVLELLIEVDRPVVDRTGLDGRYDFKLAFTKDEANAPTDGSAPPGLFTAIQEQMGLKLEPVKAPADVVVVDAVQRPTAN
jgi:uncharacterized protein (TIGR03435 family)